MCKLKVVFRALVLFAIVSSFIVPARLTAFSAEDKVESGPVDSPQAERQIEVEEKPAPDSDSAQNPAEQKPQAEESNFEDSPAAEENSADTQEATDDPEAPAAGEAPTAEAAGSETTETIGGQTDESSEIQALTDIDNTESDFKVEIWTEKEDSNYKIGDTVTFYFKTNKDSHLTLINIGTSGKVHQIFPNKYQEDNFVRANEVYTVPSKDSNFRFVLQGPEGTDTVKAIATEEDVLLLSEQDSKNAEVFQEIGKTQSEIAKDIAVTLAPINKKNWAEAELEVNITE